MNLTEFAKIDGLGLAELVKKQEVTPKELMECSLRIIEQLNPQLNAVVSVLEEQALIEIEKGLPDGPFKGVPFLIKESHAMAKGVPVHMGSRLAQGTTASADSELMSRFRKAGFVTIGTTTTPEFAYNTTTESVLHGPTRNPWNLQHSSGGSSGGSAAAAASGMVPIAHGSDGGGSIRIPASYTGLVGLKPTRGRIPSGPLASEPLNGLAVQFGLTKTVRDTAALLDFVSGPDAGCYGYAERPAVPYEIAIKEQVRPLKIAWTSSAPPGIHVEQACLDVLHETVELLESLGHTVVEDAPKYDREAFGRAMFHIWTSNIYHTIEKVAKMHNRIPGEDNVEAAIWKSYLYGKELTAADLLGAIDRIGLTSRQVGEFFTEYDVLLTPTTATEPMKLGVLDANNDKLSAEEWSEQSFAYVPFTNLFNATGQPAISLPLGWSKSGSSLPIGMQFAGKFADETTLLQLAAQLEEVKPWNLKSPLID